MKNLKNPALLLVASLLVLSGCGSTQKTELKKKAFEVEVMQKLNKKPGAYFKGNTSDIDFDWSKVNTKKTGTYHVVATKDKTKFKFKIVVKDTKAPIVKVSQKDFVFKLEGITLDQIKETVLTKIHVKDNYDKDILLNNIFDGFVLPSEEVAIKVPIVVSDEAGNKSKKVMITLQFTLDGEKHKYLKEEVIKAPVASNTQPSTSTGGNGSTPGNNTNTGGSSSGSGGSSSGGSESGSSSGGSSSGGSGSGGSGGSTDVPALPPVKPSEPDKVKTTCANFKPGLHQLGNTGLCFNTYEEADAWVTEQYINENAQYYGDYHFTIDSISNYPAWVEGEPYTINAYRNK